MRILQSRRDSGQSAVMISLLTMVVVMMIAFTSNVGQLVTEKIALQNTADFAAYSAAATQAGILNDMRDHNQKIWDAHHKARQILEKSENIPWPDYAKNPCAACVPSFTLSCPGGGSTFNNMIPELARTTLKGKVAMETGIIKARNQMMPFQAYSAADDSVDKNYKGATMTPKGGSLQMADIEQKKLDVDYYAWGRVTIPFPCPFFNQPVGFMQINHAEEDSWFYKKKNAKGEVMFAVEVSGTPATEFLGHDGGTYLGNYFGDRKELKAYAAALPMAGKMGTIKDGDLPNIELNKWKGPAKSFINNSQTGPYQVDTSSALEPSKVQGGTYHDYKVRYVGIFESDAQFPSGTKLTSSFPSPKPVAH